MLVILRIVQVDSLLNARQEYNSQMSISKCEEQEGKEEKCNNRVNIILIIEIVYVFFVVTVNRYRKTEWVNLTQYDHIHTFIFRIRSFYIQIFTRSKLVQNFLSHTWISYVWARVSGYHMIYIHSCLVWLWRMVVVFMKPAMIASHFTIQTKPQFNYYLSSFH